MYTAMLTVENLFGAHHDVWSVNVEEEYHEIDNSAPAEPASKPSGTGATPDPAEADSALSPRA